MELHLYKIREGYLVEEADTFRLLAHIPPGPLAKAMADDGWSPISWGFTDNADLAHVFATEADALEMARLWDPAVTA
jgi:hypothetical protein